MKLQVMLLDSNKFAGTVPSSLGNISGLKQVVFGGNDLTGSVPSGICALKMLREFVVDCNLSCNCCSSCLTDNSIAVTARNAGN